MNNFKLKELREKYPHGAYEWLNSLAYWLIEFKVFEKQPLFMVLQKIDQKSWLDNYYMECYSAKEAVIEDLKQINN